MADVNGILQIEMRGQRRKVVCVMIHIMAVTRLGGSAVAVMSDDAKAVIEEEQHLRNPNHRPTASASHG